MKPVLKLAGRELRMRQQRRLERHVAGDASDHERVERLAHARDGVRPVTAVHDQLGDHRVVVHRDLATLVHTGVHPHATAFGHGPGRVQRRLGRAERDEPPGGRQKAAERVFRVDAALDRPAVARHLRLREGQLLARGHSDHQLHQVQPGDALGDRMLHLQPGVHLEEVEALVGADHELHRAGTLVLHRLGQRHRLLAHRLARGVADEGRRCLLDHLLVPALDAALALVQVHHVAVRVAQHLDLDVARLLDELLDEHAVVAEAVARLVAARREAVGGVLVVEGHAKTLATAAGTGLDHHRVADVARDLHRLLRRVDGVVPSRDGVDARLPGQLLGRDLVAHGRDAVVLGADEDETFVLHPAREGFVLGQEAVAGMDGLGPRLLRGVDDAVGHEVALAAGRRTDKHSLVGQRHVQRVAVGLGIHRHGGDAHAARGLDDAAGDLAAVGNQDLGKHVSRPLVVAITAVCFRACARGFRVSCP
jgi:hypothetical protein